LPGRASFHRVAARREAWSHPGAQRTQTVATVQGLERPAGGQVASQLARFEHYSSRGQLIDDLTLDQGQVTADPVVTPVTDTRRVTIADEAHPRLNLRFAQRDRPLASRGSNVDVLHKAHRAKLPPRMDDHA
jgi:hypothetical protein